MNWRFVCILFSFACLLNGCWEPASSFSDHPFNNPWDNSGSNYSPPTLLKPETQNAILVLSDSDSVDVSYQLNALRGRGFQAYYLDSDCDGKWDDTSAGYFHWVSQKNCRVVPWGVLTSDNVLITSGDSVDIKIRIRIDQPPYSLKLRASSWDSFDLEKGRGWVHVTVSAKDSDDYSEATRMVFPLRYRLTRVSDDSVVYSGLRTSADSAKGIVISMVSDSSLRLRLTVTDSLGLFTDSVFTVPILPAPLPCQALGETQFTDERDGHVYGCASIAGKFWMTQNLNYASETSRCYGDVASSCESLGRLYTWSEALSACPEGWHLSTTTEVQGLVSWAGGIVRAADALRADTSWGYGMGGLDSTGFQALAAGYMISSGFAGRISEARFWTQGMVAGAPNFWMLLYLYGTGSSLYLPGDTPQKALITDFYSARCVHD